MDARILAFTLTTLLGFPAAGAPVPIFSTGDSDGNMATASRPESAGKFEIEFADDFIISSPTSITGATSTGLLQNANIADLGEVRVEIYRVFSNDADVGRTSGPPTFSTPQVPTRVNSPSDAEFAEGDAASFPLMGGGRPEPASLALLGTALLVIVALKRRSPT